MIPIKEGLFTTEKPQKLIGGECQNCGEVVFPYQEFCANCNTKNMSEITLSREGTIYTFSTIPNRPPNKKGEVPYSIGFVELPDGLRILSVLEGDSEKLEIDMPVELTISPVFENEDGKDVYSFRFKPKE